jgi:hypothetical protein
MRSTRSSSPTVTSIPHMAAQIRQKVVTVLATRHPEIDPTVV